MSKSLVASLCIALFSVCTPAQSVRGHNAPYVGSPNLHGSAILLPSLVEDAKTGPFIDLMRVIAKHYTHGSVTFDAHPVAWVYADTGAERTDFGFPAMRIPLSQEKPPQFRFSTERFGVVTFVLYSRKTHPLTRSDVIERAKSGKALAVMAPPIDWGFPTERLSSIESALRQVQAGRYDALLWAQEEVDSVLRENKVKGIHRTHFADFDDVFMVPRTARGDYVDESLSGAIRAARKSGELQRAYAKVHKPYNNWQPH